MTVTEIEYRAKGHLVSKEPMIFSRLYAVGQGLVLDGVSYEVESVSVENGIQKVGLKGCTFCTSCGGIEGKRTSPLECICGKEIL